jgi:DNA-directed RNA polymerase subunit H (RpoH/RPB5)
MPTNKLNKLIAKLTIEQQGRFKPRNRKRVDNILPIDDPHNPSEVLTGVELAITTLANKLMNLQTKHNTLVEKHKVLYRENNESTKVLDKYKSHESRYHELEKDNAILVKNVAQLESQFDMYRQQYVTAMKENEYLKSFSEVDYSRRSQRKRLVIPEDYTYN